MVQTSSKTTTNITVLDSIMGAGKTTYAINMMNEASEDQRFIYITPFLDQVDRIIDGVTSREVCQPDNNNDEGRKLRSFKDLILDGKDVASTHSLFRAADDELIELLKQAGYTLILDEVMDVVEPVNIQKGDITKLIEWNVIRVEGSQVIWNDDTYEGDRYADIKAYAKAGTLHIMRDTFILWAYPPRVFKTFDNVYILTYLFKAQTMRLYFDLYEMGYQMKSIKDGEIIEHDVRNEHRDELRQLIDLYDGKLNETGNKFAFSASYLRRKKARDTEALVQMRKDMYNYFQNIAKAPKAATMWATLKEVEDYLQGKGTKGQNISVTERATNEYRDRHALAYMFNRFSHPSINAFFEDNGVEVDQDLLAVSDLLQWVYRSRIRDGQPINLYLPSSRMRKLLEKWANYEI